MTLVYGRDWDYKPVCVPPSEAQFLGAAKKNEEDEPKLKYTCSRCGTGYETLADALACGCQRKGEDG